MNDASLMMSNEPVIHLKPGEKFLCDVSTTQEDLDGLNSLIHWLDGYTANSGTAVPGHYELSMLYRSLRMAHNAKHAKPVKPSHR